jgi:hypothetical protein
VEARCRIGATGLRFDGTLDHSPLRERSRASITREDASSNLNGAAVRRHGLGLALRKLARMVVGDVTVTSEVGLPGGATP